MEIKNGIWYLGHRGQLSFSERLDGQAYLSSLRSWEFLAADRSSAWFIAIEALALGAEPSKVEELVKLWKLTDEEAVRFAAYIGLRLYTFRGRWYVSFKQGSRGKFADGDTAVAALAALARPALLDAIKPLSEEVAHVAP